MSAQEPETIVAERYRLIKLLGEGGMGEVWSGMDVQTQQSIALKFMKGAALSQPELRRRFLREAKAASFVKHPCVVRVHQIVHHRGAPVMVMDLLAGESMGGRLEREQRIPLPQFARIYLQVVSAVGTAHMLDIVHRDLKPDNIFLMQTPSGEPEVRILDFGIAKFTALDGKTAETAALTGTGAMLGTPYYMSPEQVFGDKTIDHRADIWSLGVIMFESLTGARPVEGESLGQLLRSITTGQVRKLRELAPELPPDILDLSERMLSFEREKRPNDLREVYDIFRKYTDVLASSFASPASRALTPEQVADADAFADTMAGELGATGSPVTASTQPSKDRSKSIWLPIAAGILVVAVGGGFALKQQAFRISSPMSATRDSAPPPAAASTLVATPPPPPLQSAAATEAPSAKPATPSMPATTVSPFSQPKPKSKPAEPASKSSATKQPTKDLGGVASENPFN